MTVEDYLDLLAGVNPDLKFTLDAKDIKLIKSISKQLQKKIALSDRQHALIKTKILEYIDQFVSNGFTDIEQNLDNLRTPYRLIDRTKSISLVEKEFFSLFGVDKKLMIAVRFPYSSKMIKHINLIQSLQTKKEYDSKSKTHFLDFTEKNVFSLISTLKDANFQIQEELISFFNQLTLYKTDKENSVPGIYNYKLKNVHQSAKQYATSLFGDPCFENLAIYYDRKNLFGLVKFDEDLLNESCKKFSVLSQKIIKETNHQIYISTKSASYKDLFESLYELKRFPLLIVLGITKEATQLLEIYNVIKDLIPKKDISVLFRLDNTTEKNIDFNNIIKKYSLNNKLTEDTKIVFLNNTKIPKPLLINKWIPDTTLLTESFRSHKSLSTFYNSSQLIIHYDEVLSPWEQSKITKII